MNVGLLSFISGFIFKRKKNHNEITKEFWSNICLKEMTSKRKKKKKKKLQ